MISYVPLALLAVALVSTVAAWGDLVATGGWFAVLGHFLMVAATLVLLYLAGVLVLILAALPFVLLLGGNEEGLFAFAEASRSRKAPGAVLGAVRVIAARSLIAMINPLWKAVWWCWWYIRGSFENARSR